MKKVFNKGWFLLIFVIPVLIQVVWFKDGYIRGTGESGLPFYDLNLQYELTKYAWSPALLGNARGLNISSIPTDYVLAMLEKVGLPNYLIQGGFFWMIFVVAGLGIVLITKSYFPKLNEKYLLLSVFFYWFNPLSLVNVWNRFLYNFMVFWAFLPLAVYLFSKGIKDKNYRYALMLSLFAGIFSYSLSAPSFVILLWFILGMMFLFSFLLEKDKRIFLLGYLALTMVSFVGINFWWISQLATFVYSSGYTASVSYFFASNDNLYNLASLSQLLGKYYNNFIFLHGTYFTSGPSWARYFTSPIVTAGFYSISFIILWTIYKYHRKRSVLFFSLLFILTILLMKGLNPPFGELFRFVFVNSTIFQVFRNPFEKFSFLLIVAASPLFAYGLSRVVIRLKSRFMKSLVFYLSLIVIGVVWGYPYFSGNVFKGTNPVNKKELRSNEVGVPHYYKLVNNKLLQTEGDFRFISIPIGGEGITYNWEKPYSGVELSGTLFGTPNISFNTTVPFYNQIANYIRNYQMSSGVLYFAPITNSKYILFRADIDFKADRLANPETILRNYSQQRSEGFLKKELEEGQLYLYEISDEYFWPKIYTTRMVYVSNTTDLVKLSQYLPYPSSKLAIVDYEFTKMWPDINGIVLFPDQVVQQKITTPFPKDLTEEEILSSLFHVKHLPGNWYYPFVRIKEKIQDQSQTDLIGKLIYQNGILGKRAVEVYLLRKNSGQQKLITKAEKDYLISLESLEDDILEITREESSVSQLFKNTLIAQWVLLDKVHSNVVDELAALLVNFGLKGEYELPVAPNDYAIFNFHIENGGLYKVDKTFNIVDIPFYVDGKLFKGEEIELTEGRHELAYLTKGVDISTQVVTEETFFVTNDDNSEWKIQIPNMPTDYTVELEYRFVLGDSFDFLFRQDIDPLGEPLLLEKVDKDKKFHGWRKVEKKIKTNPGATSAVISMLPSTKTKCNRRLFLFNKCIKEKTSFVVEIKDMKVKQMHLFQPALILERNYNTNTNTKVDWHKVNAAEYRVNITKENDTSELLVFSELYNSGWSAKYADNNYIPESNHLLVNGYANAWVLDKPGNYDLFIRYQPQQLLNMSYKVSLLSIVISSFLLIVFYTYKKYTKHHA